MVYENFRATPVGGPSIESLLYVFEQIGPIEEIACAFCGETFSCRSVFAAWPQFCQKCSKL